MLDPIQFSIGALDITINRDGQPPHISALKSDLCISGKSCTLEFNAVKIIIDEDQLHIGVPGEENNYVRFFLSEIARIKKMLDADGVPHSVWERHIPDRNGKEPYTLIFDLPKLQLLDKTG